MVDNTSMNRAADPRQVVREYMAASRKLREEIKDSPEKARAFLLEIGILVEHQSSPNGVRLDKRYR